MDLIYIVEKTTTDYKPNFTIPNDKAADQVKDENAKLKTFGVASVAAIGVLSLNPISLLINAALATPSIYKALSSDNGNEVIDDSSIQAFQSYMDKHSISKEQALSRGYKFPPGHPLVGETYRLHPLAGYDASAKANLYIPETSFNNILLEERESELLKLLVQLGATEVKLTKQVESLMGSKKSASLSAGVEMAGSGGLSGTNGKVTDNSHLNIRIYTLVGKPWEYGDSLERSGFAWLNFEPTWDALISAREIGGCTSATLEIKEASKYIANKELSLQLKAKIFSANGTYDLMEKELQTTSYLVQVTFSKPSGL